VNDLLGDHLWGDDNFERELSPKQPAMDLSRKSPSAILHFSEISSIAVRLQEPRKL